MSSTSTAPVGFALPALRGTGGYFASKNQYDTAWGDVIMAMMTPIGSRPFRRAMGSSMADTVFDMQDGTAQSLLEHAVTAAVTRHVPHVRILRVSVQSSAPRQFDVLVEFTLREEPGRAVQRAIRIDRRTHMNALAARTR